jgi:MoxR-like ATPase
MMEQTQHAPHYQKLYQQLQKFVIGRDVDTKSKFNDSLEVLSSIELILTALYVDSHVLIEDFPGSGKSYMSHLLGSLIDDDLPNTQNSTVAITYKPYQRVQCTADLLPSDITGNWIFKKNEWEFEKGPIFSRILLVDEINRATPKVQAAFLEAMAEKQITIDTETYALKPFFVIATQNPLDKIGTFELPQAQLDRFLFKRNLAPITKDHLIAVMNLKASEAYDAIAQDKIKLSSIEAEKKELLQSLSKENDSRLDQDLLILYQLILDRCQGNTESTNDHLKDGCQLSPRTLQKIKQTVIFRCNLHKKHYEISTLTKILPDVLRHRLIPRNPKAKEKEILIENLILELKEKSIQSKKES